MTDSHFEKKPKIKESTKLTQNVSLSSYFAISGPIRNPQQLVFIGVGVCDQGKRQLVGYLVYWPNSRHICIHFCTRPMQIHPFNYYVQDG